MKLKASFCISFVFALLTIFCSTAFADLTVVQTTSLDVSTLTFHGQPLTDSQKSKFLMGFVKSTYSFGDGEVTAYYSGKKNKLVTRKYTYIVDLASQTETICDPALKVYKIVPIVARNADSPRTVFTKKELAYTKTMFGQYTHLVKTYYHNYLLSIVSYYWMAENLTDSNPFDTALGASAARLGLVGFPIKYTGNISIKHFGGAVTFKMDTTSLSTDPIDPSIFDIPADYTEGK